MNVTGWNFIAVNPNHISKQMLANSVTGDKTSLPTVKRISNERFKYFRWSGGGDFGEMREINVMPANLYGSVF